MSMLSSGLKGLERGISNAIPHVHSADRRASMQMAKEQIDYYRQAKTELEAQRKQTEADKESTRQRINETEIRARQRQYRRGGFMAPPNEGIRDSLG